MCPRWNGSSEEGGEKQVEAEREPGECDRVKMGYRLGESVNSGKHKGEREGRQARADSSVRLCY